MKVRVIHLLIRYGKRREPETTGDEKEGEERGTDGGRKSEYVGMRDDVERWAEVMV